MVQSAGVVDLSGIFGRLSVGPVLAVQPAVGPLAVPGPVLAGVPMVGVVVGPAVVAGAAGPVPMQVDIGSEEAMEVD